MTLLGASHLGRRLLHRRPECFLAGPGAEKRMGRELGEKSQSWKTKPGSSDVCFCVWPGSAAPVRERRAECVGFPHQPSWGFGVTGNASPRSEPRLAAAECQSAPCPWAARGHPLLPSLPRAGRCRGWVDPDRVIHVTLKVNPGSQGASPGPQRQRRLRSGRGCRSPSLLRAPRIRSSGEAPPSVLAAL